jgi:hypothetical protein
MLILLILDVKGTPSTMYKGSLEAEIDPNPLILIAGEEPG